MISATTWFTPITAIDAEARLTAEAVGGKAAQLARLARLGLRVPPALAISTELCRAYLGARHLPDDFRPLLREGLAELEQVTGRRLGGEPPLLVSVRSSPPISMPGMLQTVLNLGLDEARVRALIRHTGDPRLAWDAYRRYLLMVASSDGRASGSLQTVLETALRASDVRRVQDLDPLALRDLTRGCAAAVERHSGRPLPGAPVDQIENAVRTVFDSWTSPRAVEYRRLNGIDDCTGTGALIQAMVFGNGGPRSGAGVGFTRNPATGGRELYVDFLFNTQGEDVVSGRQPVLDSQLLPTLLPDAWNELIAAQTALEREFGDMQDFEFTIEDGRLYFLQTRAGKRTPLAALRIAIDLVRDQLITPDVACARLDAYDVDAIARRVVRPKSGDTPLARATSASVGVATGAAVFDVERAKALAGDRPVILMRTELTTEDLPGVSVAAGLVTTLGGRTSHAAVVARQLGKVCLVGCTELRVDAPGRECTLGARHLREGDIVTLDGETGAIYDGAVEVLTERPQAELDTLARWRQASVSG